MEMYTAMRRGKPIVGVMMEGLKQGMYDHDAMREFLQDLVANLERANPGATEILRQNGMVDPDKAGKVWPRADRTRERAKLQHVAAPQWKRCVLGVSSHWCFVTRWCFVTLGVECRQAGPRPLPARPDLDPV